MGRSNSTSIRRYYIICTSELFFFKRYFEQIEVISLKFPHIDFGEMLAWLFALITLSCFSFLQMRVHYFLLLFFFMCSLSASFSVRKVFLLLQILSFMLWGKCFIDYPSILPICFIDSYGKAKIFFLPFTWLACLCIY